VTDLNDLIELVESQPDDDLAALMLTDALMELREISRSEAGRHVKRIRETALSSRRIIAATKLLATGTASRRYLIRLVYATCRVPRRRKPIVVVTDEVGVTVRTVPNHVETDSYWNSSVITAGAQWLLDQWRDRPRPTRRRRPL
jgi:hypothetical protein